MRDKGNSVNEGFLGRRLVRPFGIFSTCLVVVILSIAASTRGDQVDMQNGDRYVGKVVSLNATTLVVQNEVLGVVRIPREKVASIAFGVSVVPSPGVSLKAPVTEKGRLPANAVPTAPNPFSELAAHTNLIRKIQSQFLGDAGPEANKKFEEMMNDLMTGKLNMDDLRAQAQAAADQLKAAKQAGDGDLGISADGYLAILDQFLKSVPASPGAKTNAPAVEKKSKPAQSEDAN